MYCVNADCRLLYFNMHTCTPHVHTCMSRTCAFLISSFLKRSLPNLAELNLRCCQITDDGMKALAESFLVKRNLKKLDLRFFN